MGGPARRGKIVMVLSRGVGGQAEGGMWQMKYLRHGLHALRVSVGRGKGAWKHT